MTMITVTLTDEEIHTLIQACADEQNIAARDLLAFAGARSFSGVMARLTISDDRSREELLAIVRRVLKRPV